MENNNVISRIGNTPLIRLKQASDLTGCDIYGKAEYFNPGESIKDRAALFIVQDAIKKKLISSHYITLYFCNINSIIAKWKFIFYI